MNNSAIELWNFKPRKYQMAYPFHSLSIYRYVKEASEKVENSAMFHCFSVAKL